MNQPNKGSRMTKRLKPPASTPPPKPRCEQCVTPNQCGTPVWHEKGRHCKIDKGEAAVGPDRCDCLNDCGDDPWLKDGRAAPCEYWHRYVKGTRYDSTR